MPECPRDWPAEPAGRSAWDLPEGEIHVWRASLDVPESAVQPLARELSADERARAARFFFERDRRRFIVCRGLLRTILGRYTGTAPDRLRFGYGVRGKPALRAPDAGGALRFNLSHSDGVALYALSRAREVGVDLERVRPLSGAEGIAERFFSRAEVAVLSALPAHLKLEAFFTCWTRKEAYVKARGDGLGLPLDRFVVSLAPGEPARLEPADGEDAPELSRWSLQALAEAPGYVAALAAEGHGWRVASRPWPELG